MARPVQVGDLAPDFTLPNQNGDPVSLSQFRGQPVVLYFYPKDDTPGCTAEACAFRDSYAEFQKLGAVVIGVSSDSVSDHRAFANRYQLPFLLVSDRNNQVRQAYGVPPTLWILPGRVTYVIDSEGIIRHIFDSQLDFAAHKEQALATLRQLAAGR
ncbi:MAG: peroxiredoxin [Thermostichales cyanobacterium SZTDM-1c_bins_54]